MKRLSLYVVIFILVKIIFFISIIFLFNALEIWIGDGVADRDHNNPYASSKYPDSDSYFYSSNENYTNNSSYNQTQWNDIDRDGIENKIDIYDYGNAGIKVNIESFNGDGIDYTYFDYKVWWDTSDPFFEIEVYCYNNATDTWEKIGYKKSKTYWDKKDILDPLTFICDVDEDATEILVKIFAKDYVNIPDRIDRGRIRDTQKPIDIKNDMNQDHISVYFYPKQNSYKEFNESNHNDSETLRKGSIKYHIEVVGL
jgi:hypothetical protein